MAGIAGGAGCSPEEPRSNVSPSVALSPRVIVSRSSEALRLAAPANAQPSQRQTTPTPHEKTLLRLAIPISHLRLSICLRQVLPCPGHCGKLLLASVASPPCNATAVDTWTIRPGFCSSRGHPGLGPNAHIRFVRLAKQLITGVKELSTVSTHSRSRGRGKAGKLEIWPPGKPWHDSGYQEFALLNGHGGLAKSAASAI
jgi:hypothetical protein